MKIEISSDGKSDLVPLSGVNFGRIAVDSDGNVYFAPEGCFLVYSPRTQTTKWANNFTTTFVTPLPFGTQLTLTSAPWGTLV